MGVSHDRQFVKDSFFFARFTFLKDKFFDIEFRERFTNGHKFFFGQTTDKISFMLKWKEIVFV